jgi:hypothetical protein
MTAATDFEFEVVRDERETAALYELTLDEQHEVLGDYPWLTWARNETKNHRLFAYRHKHTGNTVLAAWIYSPEETDKPICVEVCAFAGDPTELWPEGLLSRHALLMRLRPVHDSIQRRKKARQEELAEKRRQQIENGEGRQEAARYLKKQGLDEAAHKMAIGATPYNRKVSEQTRDAVKDLMKAARRS